jgi:hypothetical protein
MRRSVPSWAPGGNPGAATGAVSTRAGSSASGVSTVARVSRCHAEPLRQGSQGASWRITEGAQRGQEGGQEDVDPRIRWALAHAEQASLDHLERGGLEEGEQEERPIFRRWQRAGLVHRKPTDGPGCPIKAPHRQVGVEYGLKGQHQRLELVESEAREIQMTLLDGTADRRTGHWPWDVPPGMESCGQRRIIA